MKPTRTFAIALMGIATCGIAFAQAPAPAPTPAPAVSGPPSAQPTAAPPARVETWTKKQWEKAKKEWAADKAKWADCRKQSSTQKLAGRKSWSFLYNCMTG